jgi:hypothetical protein
MLTLFRKEERIMARRKIIDSDSCKFSLDVSGDNKKTLDNLTANYMLKYGPMINKIIGTFCRMPDSIKKVIAKACLTEYKKLTVALEKTPDGFHRQPLEQERESYLDILKLINDGIYVVPDEDSADNTMKKVKLADGYLIVPNDWIVVNPERAETCRYAAVLECRNSAKYDIPHFIYLNNYKRGNQYTNDMKEQFYSLCRKIWPRFSEIEELNKKNQPVPDPDNEGYYLNLEAYMNAPIIGLFSIDEQGDNLTGKYPYGAMIVRTANQSEEK